jgi:PAS domain S-box-containing protein
MAHILIVEDSATQAALITATLEDGGHRVAVAIDGEEALEISAAEHFDAVVSDIVMPGMSGYDLCRQLKGREETAHIPVILLSALSEPMDIIRGLECGADNFLTKPCPATLLRTRLQSLLDSRETRSNRRAMAGIEICFLGQRFMINSDKEQILDLLISIFEDTVRANRDLERNRAELAAAKMELERHATILEEKVAERTLELQRERAFRDLVIQNMPGAVMVKDAKTLEYVLLNANGASALGLAQSDIIGKTHYDIFGKEQADRFTARDREVLRQKQRMVAPEERLVGPDKIEHFMRINSVPVLDERGEPEYLISFAEDTTELRKLEQHVRQTQKMEAVGQLTGGLAHDFNNLLGIVLGNLDLLLERIVDDAESIDIAGEALQAARQGAELTQRMLAFSRKQPLQSRSFDLNDTVTSMSGMLRRTLGADITLTSVPSADLWPVFADPGQLGDVLLNLAVNARDAMPNGGHLVIETTSVQLGNALAEQYADITPGDYVMVAVTDSGTGMPPEILERVLEPFFTTKETGRGTGLGLSMAYAFAKQSGGYLKLYSEVGHGTSVKIFLPRAPEIEQAGKARDEEAPLLAMRNEIVLLVEDNDALRHTTARMLNELGYRVLEAEHGPAALEILEKRQDVDLMLSDVVMPKGLSGYDLAAICERIRPAVKILLMSGYSDTFLNNTSISKRPLQLVSKPCRKPDLARKLRMALEPAA